MTDAESWKAQANALAVEAAIYLDALNKIVESLPFQHFTDCVTIAAQAIKDGANASN